MLISAGLGGDEGHVRSSFSSSSFFGRVTLKVALLSTDDTISASGSSGMVVPKSLLSVDLLLMT